MALKEAIDSLYTRKKVKIVTDDGSGIGLAVANGLAMNGCQVVLAGRRLEPLDLATASIGHPAQVFKMDIGDPESVEVCFKWIETQFGRLNLLFNNAGTGVPGTILLEDIGSYALERVVSTNLSGVFYCTQAAFRLMKAQTPQGGRIINNGSVSAQSPRPNSALYTATKHAVTGLTKSAALDGRKYNVAVGQINIGNAASDMTLAMETGMSQADGSIKLEHVMDVENVVQLVRQMAALPLDSNIQAVTVMATKMPLIGRG